MCATNFLGSSVRRAIMILTIAALACLAASAESRAASPACAQATVSAASASTGVVGRAIQCLVNRERAAHGLARVRPARRLRIAAQRHAADMVARRYFEHVSLDGSSLTDRVRRARYLGRRARYALGENIGWGEQELASATAIVRAWMNSPGHRAVILDRRFREAGVGIASGVPAGDGAAGATFVLNVGTRG